MTKKYAKPNLFIDFKKTQFSTPKIFKMSQLAAGGKPSAWLPPGGLVEHI